MVRGVLLQLLLLLPQACLPRWWVPQGLEAEPWPERRRPQPISTVHYPHLLELQYGLANVDPGHQPAIKNHSANDAEFSPVEAIGAIG